MILFLRKLSIMLTPEESVTVVMVMQISSSCSKHISLSSVVISNVFHLFLKISFLVLVTLLMQFSCISKLLLGPKFYFGNVNACISEFQYKPVECCVNKANQMPTKLISQDCKIDTPRSQNIPFGKLCSLAPKILNLSDSVLRPKKIFLICQIEIFSFSKKLFVTIGLKQSTHAPSKPLRKV